MATWFVGDTKIDLNILDFFSWFGGERSRMSESTQMAIFEAVKVLARNGKTLRDALWRLTKDLMEDIQEIWVNIVGLEAIDFSVMVKAVKALGKAIQARVKKQAKTWWTALLQVGEGVLLNLNQINPTIWERIKTMTADMWDWISTKARLVFDTVKETADRAWNWVKGEGMVLRSNILFIWEDIKGWYEEHLKKYVDAIKPYIIGINAGLTVAQNVMKLKAAIKEGKIEAIFRQTIELFTSTTAEVAKALNSKILSSVAETSTFLVQKIHDTVKPIKDFIDTVERQLSRVTSFIPMALMGQFADITTWLDRTTQPFVATISMLERETRKRLSYMRANYKYKFMDVLNPVVTNSKDFEAQIQLWQFFIARLLNNY